MKQILPLLFILISSFCVVAQKDCRVAEYQQQVISNNPQLLNRYTAIENFTRNSLNTPTAVAAADSAKAAVPAIIVIPVIVHVLYNNVQQNLSDAQVMSQIEALNRDFRGTNADKINTPAYFAVVSADAGFEFKLARIDPKGYATSGIIRKQTNIQMFGLDDRIKYNRIGGDDAWDSKKYLNIWVGNIAGGVLGYTSKPGGPAEVDGVVINTSAFGTVGLVAAPFNLGRTATHEIGHWLNLRHTWGDAYCGDDEVDDTPQQRGSNRGCPSGEKITCGTSLHGDMYMNFMDLTNDACMFMFTNGQSKRMRALFAKGGARYDLLNSTALTGMPVIQPIVNPVPAPTASQEVQVSVYPNPAGSFVILSTSENEAVTDGQITIYNNIGQPVISLLMSGNRLSINVSHLPAGMYVIRKVNGGTVSVTKFIKK
ncbi:MAG: M43 family zinc metalloprotease [Chitinophagaceae bacterium]